MPGFHRAIPTSPYQHICRTHPGAQRRTGQGLAAGRRNMNVPVRFIAVVQVYVSLLSISRQHALEPFAVTGQKLIGLATVTLALPNRLLWPINLTIGR
ncbi:hypothetical protein [Fibrisoma limi]|uniref:hypothetical protein n=1 Tax=Fibrisoma limi TaxID=663275 RepID=UPI001181C29B|nr:hypothetical protein [Fibrisoma limi]